VPETSIRLVTNSLPSTPAAAAAAGENVGAAAADAQNASAQQSEKPVEVTTTDTPAELPLQPFESEHVTINFADGTYIPTNAIAENARQALKVRDTKPASQRGMTSVGLARARDLMNKRPQSEDTVRRMKAFFDRHEADKQGETWDEKGKGWQAWNGWGGDEGYVWATSIVERLNKQADAQKINAASAEVRQTFAAITPPAPEEWLDAVQNYRSKQNLRVDEIKASIIGEKSIIELTKIT
jgi:hypothetical protein